MSSITKIISKSLQHFLLFGDIKNRKQDNNTKDVRRNIKWKSS
jgi:hypothetical protein